MRKLVLLLVVLSVLLVALATVPVVTPHADAGRRTMCEKHPDRPKCRPKPTTTTPPPTTITPSPTTTVPLPTTSSTTTPPPPTAYDCSGAASVFTVPSGTGFTAGSPPANACYDARNATISGMAEGSRSVRIGESTASSDTAYVGGSVIQTCSFAYTWSEAHDACSGGPRIFVAGGTARFAGFHVDNGDDAIKPREVPEFSGSGSLLVEGVYATNVRDDVIENDNFMPGTIRDDLFDGVHTFLSEQCQPCTGPTVSAGEDPNIYISNVLVRLKDPNADDREGRFFKYQGDGNPQHHPVITDSVFAISGEPNSGWSRAGFQGAEFHGTNYLLWLGAGAYGGEIPPAMTFLQGQAARDKWCQVRADWLTSHGRSVGTCDTAP